MTTLLDLPVKGAKYVHTNGVPFVSSDPVYAELLEWIEKLGMELVVLGVSGYAAAAQIKWLADAMQAKVTIQLHGFTWKGSNLTNYDSFEREEIVIRPRFVDAPQLKGTYANF